MTRAGWINLAVLIAGIVLIIVVGVTIKMDPTPIRYNMFQGQIQVESVEDYQDLVHQASSPEIIYKTINLKDDILYYTVYSNLNYEMAIPENSIRFVHETHKYTPENQPEKFEDMLGGGIATVAIAGILLGAFWENYKT